MRIQTPRGPGRVVRRYDTCVLVRLDTCCPSWVAFGLDEILSWSAAP